MENMENTEIFVVMDTETNWCNEVMSIGVAIANCETFELIDTRYYILNPEYLIGGMFSAVLQINGNPPAIECNRREAVCDLEKWLEKYNEPQKLFRIKVNETVQLVRNRQWLSVLGRCFHKLPGFLQECVDDEVPCISSF